MSPQAGFDGRWIGAAVPRKEDRRMLLGLGRFTGDLTRPGLLHAAFVRSPHAHALVGKIDATAASQISNTLNGGTNVVEETTASGATGAGVQTAGAGDINVNAAISWTNASASLTLEALGQGNAVLLSNYCAVTTGATLDAALVRAQELETLARFYAIALSLGRPAILSDEEIGRIGERLRSNGADVEARVAALVETRSKAKAPPKVKRVARKRRS